MRLQDRFDQDRIRQPEDSFGHSGGASGSDLAQVRRLADELLSAADEAIRKALSGDSQQFLQANRQQGGE